MSHWSDRCPKCGVVGYMHPYGGCKPDFLFGPIVHKDDGSNEQAAPEEAAQLDAQAEEEALLSAEDDECHNL